MKIEKTESHVINNSFDKDTISFSDEASECISDCREFNMKNIYKNPTLLKEESKISNMYGTLFDHFLTDLHIQKKDSWIYQDMKELEWISREYLNKASEAELVRDYIAGMTDRYFESAFKKITIPERVSRYYNGGKK